MDSCPGQGANATSHCDDDSIIDDEKRIDNPYCDCGYVGPLCSVCDDNYLETWAGYRTCQPCGDGASYTPLIVLVSSVMLIGLSIAACVFKIKGCKKKLEALYATGENKLNILFFAAQMISQFASISGNTGEKRKYPQPAATVAAALGVSNVEVFSFVSLRCMMPETHFYTTLLFKTVGPFIVVVLLWIYPLVCYVSGRGARTAWHFSARWSLVFLEVIVPATTTTIAQTLACDQFDDGRFLRVQYTLACDGSPRRRKWVIFSYLMLAVYPIGACERSSAILFLSLSGHSSRGLSGAGVPLLLIAIIYPRREQINKLLTDIIEQDEKTNTVTVVRDIRATTQRSQRASIVRLSTTIEWLAPKFQQFLPECWYFGAIALVLRLCQSSMMVVFDNQRIQAACASMVAQAAICTQRHLSPYRRASDNEIALYAQWLIFTWCSIFFLRVIGATAFLATFIVGLFCVVPTVGVAARALQATLTDIECKLIQDDEAAKRANGKTCRAYREGDFILQAGCEDSQLIVSAMEFALLYEPSFELAPEPSTPEGFQPCYPAGKINALKISANEVKTNFPAARFIASFGAEIRVAAGDFLAMPFHQADELSVIPKEEFPDKYTNAYIDSTEIPPETNERVLTQVQVLSEWQATLRAFGKRYRKKVKAHAKFATKDGILENVADGVTEARMSFRRGDFIVAGSRGRRHAMPALLFAAEYDRLRPEIASDKALAEEGFQLYASTATIFAREVSEDECAYHFPSGRFVGRWGGIVTVSAGDYLATPSNTADAVFAIPKGLFAVLYEMYSQETTEAVSQSEALAYWKGGLQLEARVCCLAKTVRAKRALEDGAILGRAVAPDSE